jgi:leucyl-tRNA synthetase
MELFGPDFEGYDQASQDAASSDTAEPKAKTAAPAAPTYQFQIMESIGVPRSEIKKFADSIYWTKYFPPIAKVVLFALSISDDSC